MVAPTTSDHGVGVYIPSVEMPQLSTKSDTSGAVAPGTLDTKLSQKVPAMSVDRLGWTPS